MTFWTATERQGYFMLYQNRVFLLCVRHNFNLLR